MILAGDIGGTKTHLALYDWTGERIDPVRLETFHSADYASLDEMLTEFLAPPKAPLTVDQLEQTNVEDASSVPVTQDTPLSLEAACFGVAGPVFQNHSRTTNLPWVVDGPALSKQFDIRHVQLLNDLEAMAHGILLLRPDELVTLNAGTRPSHKQAIALIAPGVFGEERDEIEPDAPGGTKAECELRFWVGAGRGQRGFVLLPPSRAVDRHQ